MKFSGSVPEKFQFLREIFTPAKNFKKKNVQCSVVSKVRLFVETRVVTRICGHQIVRSIYKKEKNKAHKFKNGTQKDQS